VAHGPKPTVKILLKAEEIEELRRIARLRKAPYAEVVRAKVILLAWEHPDWSNSALARKIGCALRTVQRWRQRWKKGGRRTVQERERSGAPRFFSL
jgi:transposase